MNYDDIINLPHHEPKFHPRMSRQARAAQFAPFAALNGHAKALSEAEQEHLEQIREAESPEDSASTLSP
jgi:hypothetical protein